MFYSMTGYGSDLYSDEKYSLETEIKSLNSRFLDLSVRLPKELSQFEFEIRDLVKAKILRGKVSVNINVNYNLSLTNTISINVDELNQSVNILNRIKDLSNVSNDIDMNQILMLRENFIDKSEDQTEIDILVLKDSVNRAIDNLIEMRGKEGAELKVDFISRIQIIDQTLNKIENIANDSVQEYFEKFKEKVRRLHDEFSDDEDRFMIELGILSEKHDVTEECTRLRSHIKLFNETLEQNQDVGRKLNFICQEMNREVNTINSKSISSEISHLGINIKEELEKIREQVQNVE